MDYNALINAKMGMTNRQAAAQENAAAAAANGQVNAARMNSEGNTLATLWQQPAAFATSMGDLYGNYAANTGAQGGNYANTYGALNQGLASLGNSGAADYGAYAQGLSNLSGARSQNLGNMYAAQGMGEVARQQALSNIGSAALGAYGGASNAAMQALALQQQAYNAAMGQGLTANQNAMSALGQSRNNALANLASAYSPVAGAAAQLGAAGLAASRYENADSYSREEALSQQRSGGSGSATARSNAYATAGDAASPYASSGFQASGPEGTIASGRYSGQGGGSGLGMYGSKTSSGDQRQSNYADAMSGGSRTNRTSTRSGPQMDAFNSSLQAGMAGIGGVLGGLRDTRSDVMDNSYMNALKETSARDLAALQSAGSGFSGVPRSMLADTLSGLSQLGRQGYRASANGMNQFYDNLRSASAGDPTRDAMNMLAGGFASRSSALDGLRGDMNAGYGNAVGNINNVGSALSSGYGSARSDVQEIYDGSVGNWMAGRRDPGNYLAPAFDAANNVRVQQAGKVASEQAKFDDAMRAARQVGAASGYVVTPTGDIVRNRKGYIEPGEKPLTGTQASLMMARRGAGPESIEGYRPAYGSRYGAPAGSAPVPIHPDYRAI